MNGGYFQAVTEVPLQQGRVQQDLFHAHESQKLWSSPNHLLLSSLMVLFHLPEDRFFPNGIHNEQGAEFTEPFL